MTELISLLNEQLEGRYHVAAEVGRGGMATIFRAEDLKHDRTVALKVLLPELAAVVGAERFLREIRFEAQLWHPHILPLLDSGAVDGLPFYTMPFVRGESLADRLRRETQLPVETVVRIGIEVADALAHAHEQGVVHRDIKPANIMLEGDHAVVADFGIALATERVAGARLTSSTMAPGSPVYMSPEQASGDSDLDHRTDLYSLGCTLYEALAGDPPFVARVPRAILAKKLSERPPSLRVVRTAVPEALERVILKALARDPPDRFQRAEEMRDALAAVSEGSVVAPEVAPAPARADEAGPAPWYRRRPEIAWTLGGLTLVTVVGALTDLAYDLRMGIPPEYGSPLWMLPILGVRALLPHLIWVLFVGILWLAAAYALRPVGWALGRAPTVTRTLGRVRDRATRGWLRVRHRLEPRTVADVFLLVAVVVGILVFLPFRDVLAIVDPSFTSNELESDASPYRAFIPVLTVVIATLFLSWRALFRRLRAQGPLPPRIEAVRWGSLAWIALVLMLATVPWRLTHQNHHERALLDGERAYILGETPEELLVFRPELGASVRVPKGPDTPLDRLGVAGFAFEDPEAFQSGEPTLGPGG